jgi:hypothetical protein
MGGARFSVKFRDILDTLLRDILDTLSTKAGAWRLGSEATPQPPAFVFLQWVFWFLWARIGSVSFGAEQRALRRIAMIAAASRLSTARVGTDHQGAWY